MPSRVRRIGQKLSSKYIELTEFGVDSQNYQTSSETVDTVSEISGETYQESDQENELKITPIRIQVTEEPANCWSGLTESFYQRSIWFKDRYHRLQWQVKHLQGRVRHLCTNQVDLMLEMMPAWTDFLADCPRVYGHYTFINRSGNDLAVYLTIDIPRPEPSEETELIMTIQDVFYPYGCRVRNCCLNYLDDTNRFEGYHQNYLRRPINNQRYQLFLLALENYTNWRHYQAQVEAWEINQLLERYLRTNLLQMIDNLPCPELKSMSRRRDKKTEIYREPFKVTSKDLEPWVYIIDPFTRLNFSLAKMRQLAINSVKDYYSDPRIGAVIRLVNLAYNIPEIGLFESEPDSERETTGFWQKVFMKFDQN